MFITIYIIGAIALDVILVTYWAFRIRKVGLDDFLDDDTDSDTLSVAFIILPPVAVSTRFFSIGTVFGVPVLLLALFVVLAAVFFITDKKRRQAKADKSSRNKLRFIELSAYDSARILSYLIISYIIVMSI